MIVQCTSCQTKFRLPDERLKPSGVKVRCSKCQHVFLVTPSSTQVPVGVAHEESTDRNIAPPGYGSAELAASAFPPAPAPQPPPLIARPVAAPSPPPPRPKKPAHDPFAELPVDSEAPTPAPYGYAPQPSYGYGAPPAYGYGGGHPSGSGSYGYGGTPMPAGAYGYGGAPMLPQDASMPPPQGYGSPYPTPPLVMPSYSPPATPFPQYQPPPLPQLAQPPVPSYPPALPSMDSLFAPAPPPLSVPPSGEHDLYGTGAPLPPSLAPAEPPPLPISRASTLAQLDDLFSAPPASAPPQEDPLAGIPLASAPAPAPASASAPAQSGTPSSPALTFGEEPSATDFPAEPSFGLSRMGLDLSDLTGELGGGVVQTSASDLESSDVSAIGRIELKRARPGENAEARKKPEPPPPKRITSLPPIAGRFRGPEQPSRLRSALVASLLALSAGGALLHLAGGDPQKIDLPLLASVLGQDPPPRSPHALRDIAPRDVHAVSYPGANGLPLLVIAGRAENVGAEAHAAVEAVVYALDGDEVVTEQRAWLGLTLGPDGLGRVTGPEDVGAAIARALAAMPSPPATQVLRPGETREFSVVFAKPPDQYERLRYKVEFRSANPNPPQAGQY